MVAVVFLRFLVELLGSTRLASEEHVGELLRNDLLRRTAVHHAEQHGTDCRRRTFRNHAAHFRRLVLLDHIPVGIEPFTYNHRFHQHAAIRDRRIGHRHLDWRNRNSMAKAHSLERTVIARKLVGHEQAALLFALEIFRSRHAEAEIARHKVELLRADFRGNFRKHDVRRLHHRFRHVHVAVDVRIANLLGFRVPCPAAPFVLEHARRGDNLVLEGGSRGNHLERGTRFVRERNDFIFRHATHALRL